MLRGCQKQMVMLKTVKSHLFESAWFVLREERGGESEEDMIAEAHRIVAGGVLPRRRPFRWLLHGAVLLRGALSGAGGLALVSFFL